MKLKIMKLKLNNGSQWSSGEAQSKNTPENNSVLILVCIFNGSIGIVLYFHKYSYAFKPIKRD